MAAKKKKKKILGAPKLRQGDKTAFVRKQPRSMSASDVRAKAAEAGMDISIPYIHNIRSAIARDAREKLGKPSKAIAGKDKKQQEALFEQLVVVLGPARCRKLLDKVEAALRTQ